MESGTFKLRDPFPRHLSFILVNAVARHVLRLSLLASRRAVSYCLRRIQTFTRLSRGTYWVNVASVWIMELFSTMVAFCYAIFDVPCALSLEFRTGLLWFSTQMGIRRCVSFTEREKFREIEILFHQLLLLNFYADFIKYLIWITSSILNCVFQLSLNYQFLCICERLGRNTHWTKYRCK